MSIISCRTYDYRFLFTYSFTIRFRNMSIISCRTYDLNRRNNNYQAICIISFYAIILISSYIISIYQAILVWDINLLLPILFSTWILTSPWKSFDIYFHSLPYTNEGIVLFPSWTLKKFLDTLDSHGNLCNLFTSCITMNLYTFGFIPCSFLAYMLSICFITSSFVQHIIHMQPIRPTTIIYINSMDGGYVPYHNHGSFITSRYVIVSCFSHCS